MLARTCARSGRETVTNKNQGPAVLPPEYWTNGSCAVAGGLDLRLGVRRRRTAPCQGNINRLVAAQNERAGADLRPAARFTLDLGPGMVRPAICDLKDDQVAILARLARLTRHEGHRRVIVKANAQRFTSSGSSKLKSCPLRR